MDATSPLLRVLVADRRLDEPTAAAVAAHAARVGVGVDTALQKLGLLDEDAVLAALPRAYGGAVADDNRLAAAGSTAVGALPRAVAEQHGLVPLELAGRKLTVACPIPTEIGAFETVLDEVGFALRLYLRPLWTTELLCRAHLHRLYGTPLPEVLHRPARGTSPPDPRARRRSAADDGTDDAADGGAGHSDIKGDINGDINGGVGERRAGAGDADDADLLLFSAVDAAAAPPSSPPIVVDDSATWFAAQTPDHGDRPAAPPPLSVTARGVAPVDASGWSVGAPGDGVIDDDDDLPASARIALVIDGTVAAAAAAPGAGAAVEDDDARQARRRKRVLWSFEDAAAELALATTRDELLEVAIRFAWRRLQTAAVVVRNGDELVVWDILDGVHDGAALRDKPLPADGAHVLAVAFALGSPYLGPLGENDPLAGLLGRAPRTLLVVPVALPGRRPLAALVGDNGDRPIALDVVGALHRLAPRLGHALGALIMRRKRARPPTSPLPTFAPAPATTEPPAPASGAAPAPPPNTDAELELVLAPASPPRPPPSPGTSATTSTASSSATSPSASAAPTDSGATARPSLLAARWLRWRTNLDEPAPGADVVAAVIAGDDDAAPRVRALGGDAVVALARAFPGALVPSPFVGRAQPLGALPRPSSTSIGGLVVDLGADTAAPILVGALDEADRDARWLATRLLALLDVPAALPRLAARVFDVEGRVGNLAIEVLARRRSSAGFAAVLVHLRGVARDGDDVERERAMTALADLRDVGAVPVLVEQLRARPANLAAAAHAALVTLTGVDHGFAEARWRAWLARHGDEPRHRWLLRALRLGEPATARAAASDLAADGIDLHGWSVDVAADARAIAVDAIAHSLGETPP